MQIEQFKAALGQGGARPNQFLVTMNWPTAIAAPGGTTNYLITSASLPASNVGPTIVYFRGREVKLAGERTFDPWQIEVVNDSEMTLRRHFEDWSNLMNNYQDNSGSVAPTSYWVDALVQQLDRNERIIKTYNMRGIFPIEVGENALGYGLNDTVSTFTVTFAINDFERQ